MKALIVALQFMTRLPLPAIATDSVDMARAMRWFPVAGLVVGASVWGACLAGALINPPVAALCGLVAWVALTGALHLDGLGDVADAAGAGHRDPSRISAVLADPHIGSFGVTAIGLQLLAKFVGLIALCESQSLWALPALCAVARVGPLVWTLTVPALHEGMGTLFAEELHWVHLIVWMCLTLGAAWFAPSLLVAMPAMALWAVWVRARIGGISGDSHGAGIELVESLLLIAMVAAR